MSPTWFLLVCWHSMPRQCYLAICDFRTQTRCFAIEVAEYRFTCLKTCEEEETSVASAILKSTQYKNKWAAGIFDNLQRALFF